MYVSVQISLETLPKRLISTTIKKSILPTYVWKGSIPDPSRKLWLIVINEDTIAAFSPAIARYELVLTARFTWKYKNLAAKSRMLARSLARESQRESWHNVKRACPWPI